MRSRLWNSARKRAGCQLVDHKINQWRSCAIDIVPSTRPPVRPGQDLTPAQVIGPLHLPASSVDTAVPLQAGFVHPMLDKIGHLAPTGAEIEFD